MQGNKFYVEYTAMIPPSALIHPLLKCWFVIIPLGQLIEIHRRQIKGSANKSKSFKTVGDTQTTSDMGIPFLYVYLLSFL